MPNEKCTNCGHIIGEKESTHVHRGKLYCVGCIQMIEPPAPAIHYARPTEETEQPRRRKSRPFLSTALSVFGVIGMAASVIVPFMIWATAPRPVMYGMQIDPPYWPYAAIAVSMFALSLCVIAAGRIIGLLSTIAES